MAEHEDWVEIAHPQIEKTARVSPRSVKHWEGAGWKPVTAPESPAPATPKAPEKKAEVS